MRILLTGDMGFIGSALKEKLKAQGHYVYGMDIKRDALGSYPQDSY